MLTSGGLSGESDRARALGISAYLTKPVRQSELFDVVMKILEATTAPSVDREAPSFDGEPESSAPPRALRILLAEDHVVNQKVAVCMLQGMGHHATVVSDGRQAVETWRSGHFDLILMDVQMPEMDGIETTLLIRQHEKRNGGYTPILALTAHTEAGDRERCLEAGMDGYIRKPIDAVQFLEMAESAAGQALRR